MAELPKVIIFGPGGNVGAATAQSVHHNGAEVVLAMRDPEKNLPWTEGKNFERVKADLMAPATVHDAVTKTAAKRAFIYWVRGAEDGMIGTIEALKSGGIEFVVFLSSFAIQGDAKNEVPENPLQYAHAQVEVNLEKLFPSKYAALRPAYFASNIASWRAGIQSGTLDIYLPETECDFVSIKDIGDIAGGILARGLKGPPIVSIVGPDLLTQRRAVAIIAEVLDKPIKVVEADRETALGHYMNLGLSRPLAVLVLESIERLPGRMGLPPEAHAEGSKNVELYAGRPSTKFVDWFRQNTFIVA